MTCCELASTRTTLASETLIIVQHRCLINEAAIRCILVAMMSSSAAWADHGAIC